MCRSCVLRETGIQPFGTEPATVNSSTNLRGTTVGVLVAISLALAAVAFGQSSSLLDRPATHADRSGRADAIPSANAILKKYLKATGGRKAWEKIHSRRSQGNVIIPSMNLIGSAEMLEEAPDRALVKIVVAGSTFLEGFDGSVAWSSDPKQGVREQTGAQMAETRRESDFRFPLDFRKVYPKVSAPTATAIDNRAVYAIDATPPGGEKPDRAYFDAQTGLLVRMITQHHDDDGTIEPFQQDLSDYRVVDGVEIPFTIHQTGAQVDFTIEIKNVHQNVPVDDTLFSKPVAQ